MIWRGPTRFFLPIIVLALAGCATTLDREELATEYYNIGTAYFELGDLTRSATYLSRATELDPALARASYNLARVLIEQGENADAVTILEELLAADPTNAIVLETLGYAEYRAGNLDQAGSWYDRALDVNGTDTDLLLNRATVHRELEQYGPAATLLGEALAFRDDDPQLVLELAETQRLAGDSDAAISSYERYLELAADPEPGPVYELALLYEQAEYFADALAAFETVSESAQAGAELRADASFARSRILYLAAEEPQQGLDQMRVAISLGFSDTDAATELAEAVDTEARGPLLELMEEAGLVQDGNTDEQPPSGPDDPDAGATDPNDPPEDDTAE